MTEACSHLIALPGRRIRVLRLFAGAETYALRYDVERGEDYCRVCGCTAVYGCAGGCAWVTPAHDLCSRCLEEELLP